MPKKTTEAATVLAFARSLEISDGYFTQIASTNPTQESAVNVREKTVCGTFSHNLKKNNQNDPVKLDPDGIANPNPHTIDVATLDEDKDTLIARFTLKALPFTGKPWICNNRGHQEKIQQTIKDYLKKNGLNELARRYASNIANARWLWRNRIGAENITVIVKNGEEEITINEAKTLSLHDFVAPREDVAQKINTIANWICEGLQGKAFTLLEVEARAFMGKGQKVFPSQEFIRKENKKNEKGEKLKVLYTIDDKAGMHSQKIGNAIRTIDTWYDNNDAKFPIAVEPYGAVTTLGDAFRQPRDKNDFYTLFDNWVQKKREEPDPKKQHYVVAVLIRGGVFGESGKE